MLDLQVFLKYGTQYLRKYTMGKYFMLMTTSTPLNVTLQVQSCYLSTSQIQILLFQYLFIALVIAFIIINKYILIIIQIILCHSSLEISLFKNKINELKKKKNIFILFMCNTRHLPTLNKQREEINYLTAPHFMCTLK